MNKLMIMLGLLLIAGLSFAFVGPWQNEWQNYASWRYMCNIEEVGTEQYILADYMYVAAQPYIPYSQITSMNNYLYYMAVANSGMMWDYYPSPFRADMAAYNTNNGAFKTIFNAVLRTYLQHGGSSSYVMGMLNGFNANYRDCIMAGPWPSGPVDVD